MVEPTIKKWNEREEQMYRETFCKAWKLCSEVLQNPNTKNSTEMVKAITELLKVTITC